MSQPPRAVFLSYASQDAAAAQRICDALRAGGIEVWFDQNELRSGDVWDRQIRDQIQGCALLIPIISSNTQARPEGYFRLEWKLAVERTHLMSERKAFLVPVVIDDTRDTAADVPQKFREVQWSRLPQGETPSGFVERVASLLGSSTTVTGGTEHLTEPLTPAAGQSTRRPVRAIASLLLVALAALVTGYLAFHPGVPLKPHADSARSPSDSSPAPSAVSEKSIAVLPFVDLSEKKDQEYFSDGLAEELLDLLAKTPGLHVIARTSSFSFKGKSDDIPTIARKLNVANILEGSVRKAGSRLRVTTQLVRVSTGEPLWSETYDRELKDVFAVQDEIATAVVGELRLKLAPAPLISARRTSNIEAYNDYLLGREFHNQGGPDGNQHAIEAYRKAIALDPNYAAAYAALAVSEFQLADMTSNAAGTRRAIDTAEKAVQLGPDDPVTYAARAMVRLEVIGDWAGAEADIEKAITLDPADAQSQTAYSEILATLGRMPEAIAAVRRGIALDPLRRSGWSELTIYLIYTRDFAGAHEASRRVLDISPNFSFGLADLGTLQLLEGNAQGALLAFSKVGLESFRLCGTAMAAYSIKDPAASQQALDQLIAKHSKMGAYQIAQVYAWRGEKDKAFEWLDRAYAQQDGGLSQTKYDALVDSLRGDPRYSALLRKLKLPE